MISFVLRFCLISFVSGCVPAFPGSVVTTTTQRVGMTSGFTTAPPGETTTAGSGFTTTAGSGFTTTAGTGLTSTGAAGSSTISSVDTTTYPYTTTGPFDPGMRDEASRKKFKHDFTSYKGKNHCHSKQNVSTLFISSSISDYDMETSFGVRDGSICSTCNLGYGAYFASSHSNVYNATFDAITTVKCEHALDLCICDINDLCYSPNSPNLGVILYPACISGKCHVYGMLRGHSDEDAIVSSNKLNTFYVNNQYNTETLEYWPLDMEGVFVKVRSVSCNRCTNNKMCLSGKKKKKEKGDKKKKITIA
uniref:Uncharacterized protein n=1 Tax=Rhabditophanes sp. KR3021 TaxID=114890 RepID=A0AC35UCI6_9BILA